MTHVIIRKHTNNLNSSTPTLSKGDTTIPQSTVKESGQDAEINLFRKRIDFMSPDKKKYKFSELKRIYETIMIEGRQLENAPLSFEELPPTSSLIGVDMDQIEREDMDV